MTDSSANASTEQVNYPFPLTTRDWRGETLRRWGEQPPSGYQRIWYRRDPQNPNLLYWKPDAQYRYRQDLPPAVWDSTKQFQGYWDDPKKIVNAYNYLRVQDDDFEPPAYLDKDFINSMYKTLEAYNNTEDTALWKPLPYGSEESYYAYNTPGPDWWEATPGNRMLLPKNNLQPVNFDLPSPAGTGSTVKLTTGVEVPIENMQAVVDEVNAELLIQLQQEQITKDEYDQSVKYFSQYALSEEGRAYLAQNLTEEQLAQPFDPRDYSQLTVTGLLEQQGVLDLEGKPFKEYTEMEPFAQTLLTLFGSPENLNAPVSSKQTSAVVQGVMTGAGAWGAVATYGAIAAKMAAGPAAAFAVTGVGVPVAVAIPVIAIAIGGTIGYLQYNSAITGKENVVSKAYSNIMNFLSEKTEQVIGTTTIMSEINKAAEEVRASGATEEEVSKVMLEKYGVTSQDFWENFGRAWTASRMYYESSGGKGPGDWLVDTVSVAAHAISPAWSSGRQTSPGEVWQLQLGKDSPSALGLNSTDTRAAIMRDIYALGPEPSRQDKEAVFAMWQDALGMSGNMNDFVGQIFIDPLNFAPATVNKGLDVYSQKQFKNAVDAGDLPTAKWYANLSEAAKAAPGNPLIDSLPFGVQNITESLIRFVSGTPQGEQAPKWLRGTINPVSTWNMAAGRLAGGYQPKMMVDLLNDMRSKGYSAPVGATLDISGGTPGMTPTVKVFVSSDRMHAQFNLIGTDGSTIGRQFISSDGNMPFTDVNDVIKQFKEMVSADYYKEQFPNDAFENALMGDLKVEHSGTITYFDYLKTYADELAKAGIEQGAAPAGKDVYDDMLKSIGKPVIIDAETGAVVSEGRLVIDSVKEDSPVYQITSVDGKTVYTINAGNDEIVNMKVDGQDVLLPRNGLIVAPYKVAELSDPYVSRINIKAVNDFAESLGAEKPYPTEIDLIGAKPSAGAEPTKLTGNKITDAFLKLNDYTPEAKIAITNKAVVESILGAFLITKNDPDKFFTFFDYLAGRKVEVSPAMQQFASGKVVATAMLTLKSALKDGSQFYVLRDAWESGAIRRVEVTNFARILELPPEKLITMKPDDIFKRLTAYNTRVAKTDPTKVLDMTAAEIKKFLSPYTGANALPLTKQDLVARATFAFVSDSERAAIQMFDPEVKSNFTQFSNMLKSIIGIPLISANPATWMMNAFNNWSTMNIFVGAGGLSITGKSMADSIKRFGVDYTKLIEKGFKLSDVETSATKELQEILNPDNWMTDVRHFIGKLSTSEKTPLDPLAHAAKVSPENLIHMSPEDIVKAIKKSGDPKIAHLSVAQVERMMAPYTGENAKPLTKTIFNPLATYGKIEQFFAARTMKLSIDQYMRSAPLSEISPNNRAAMINAGMTERQVNAFQSAANKAYNTDEINSFYKNGQIDYNPVPDEIINKALDNLSNGDPAQRAAINTLLDFNGLRDDLVEMLKKPRTPEELDAIQADLFNKLSDVADQTRANNLAAEFSKITEDTSGHIGLLKNLYMVAQQEYLALHFANKQFGDYWSSVDQAAKVMDEIELPAYKAAMWDITSRNVNKMWNSTYKVMLNGVMAGMQKVGLGEDGDFFVNNLAERLTLMQKIYTDIQKTNDDAYDGVIKDIDSKKLLNQIYSDYQKARDANQKAWVDKIIELYDKNGVSLSGMTKEQMHAHMVGYMGEFLKRDRTFRNKILDHHRVIETLDYSTKRAANKAFYEETYQADSLNMLKFLTNEAYENFNTKRPAKYVSKGAAQTAATKPKAMTPEELTVENKRSIFNRNETAIEHNRMMNDQAKAAYGQYNKQLFQNELFAATNLTEPQRSASIAYFDAFDATVQRLSNDEFGFYDRVGSIDAFESDVLPQDKFISPTGEKYIAAMTYGPDGKFILNFATEAADAVSVWHEGSHTIVDTARRLYEMDVFDGYKTIIEDAGKTTIEAFNAMDDTARGKVYDDIADSMFKWQSDAEVAKSMPAGLNTAFTTMAQFFTDLINNLFKRYKDIEVTPALKEVYRSLFVNSDETAKADRNATRIKQYQEGISNNKIEIVLNDTIDNWGDDLRNYFEPVLAEMKSEIDITPAPPTPPDWANVEGLYNGETYKPLITTIDEILSNKEISELSYPEMRELILKQAHNRLIAKDGNYRMYNGMLESPEVDLIRANRAIDTLKESAVAEGTDLEKYNAVATPLKEAIGLLDELKTRKGDPQSIANLEAAIAAAPIKILSDADIPRQGLLFNLDELTYQPGEQPLPPVTPDPPQGPLSINQSSAIDQLTNNEIMNLVGEITDGLQGYMRDNVTFEMENGIPAKALTALQKQSAIWENELDIKKLSAMDYAKLTRDHTLLDYTQRRGIDQLLQHVFPYHFWYTTSVTEWAKHLIADPTVASAYSKYQELRRKNGMLGFPSRLAGKMWLPAPWLPDYLGDEITVDPFSRLMPLESIMQPVSLFTDLSTDMTASTVRIINQMVNDKVISPEQAAAAIQNETGGVWEDALAQAIQEDESALSDTMTLASYMMGVAPWWQYSYYFATGQKEKISVLPTTRMGQAMSSFRRNPITGEGTWAGDMVSIIGNIIKAPEEKVREVLDMSAYGEPGDYYIRLMLTSMLGDGTVTDVDEVEKQMIERKGDYWEEAKRRADVYLSARLPGSLFLHTVNNFTMNPTPQNAGSIPQAFFLTMFPAGMIPEGEQVLRGIAPEYQQAWKEYNMGNKEALNEFEDKYPEYRARRDMFKDNDTLLKGFLVDQIWEKWTSIPKASRQLATESLGSTFESAFLEAKAYDKISNETLASWSLRLGGMVPETPQTELSQLDYAPVPRYNPQVEAAVTTFQDERARLFPNYYWQQQIYWGTEKENRDKLKRTMPEYFKYLEWKKTYYETDPLVQQWAEDIASRSSDYDSDLLMMQNQSDEANAAIANGSVLFEFDDVLKAELGKYFINGTPLSSGALAELNRLWVTNGKPGDSLQQWIDAVLGLRK